MSDMVLALPVGALSKTATCGQIKNVCIVTACPSLKVTANFRLLAQRKHGQQQEHQR